MTKKDFRQAIFLTILIVGLVLSLTTGFLERIIVPIGLAVFAVLAFFFANFFVFHIRRFAENHPYIPYAGKLAHVICKECMKTGSDSRIEVEVGTAFEGWSKAGRYFRGFRRTYRATCERGHSWTYDPILERNYLDTSARRKLTPEEKAAARARSIARSRAIREGFHKVVFGTKISDSESAS